MKPLCRCGAELKFSFEQLGCVDCGAACCPACAYQLESASYCPACAEVILDLPGAHRTPAGSMTAAL